MPKSVFHAHTGDHAINTQRVGPAYPKLRVGVDKELTHYSLPGSVEGPVWPAPVALLIQQFEELRQPGRMSRPRGRCYKISIGYRSEEHTSELQSRPHLVCRLLL